MKIVTLGLNRCSGKTDFELKEMILSIVSQNDFSSICSDQN